MVLWWLLWIKRGDRNGWWSVFSHLKYYSWNIWSSTTTITKETNYVWRRSKWNSIELKFWRKYWNWSRWKQAKYRFEWITFKSSIKSSRWCVRKNWHEWRWSHCYDQKTLWNEAVWKDDAFNDNGFEKECWWTNRCN